MTNDEHITGYHKVLAKLTGIRLNCNDSTMHNPLDYLINEAIPAEICFWQTQPKKSEPRFEVVENGTESYIRRREHGQLCEKEDTYYTFELAKIAYIELAKSRLDDYSTMLVFAKIIKETDIGEH